MSFSSQDFEGALAQARLLGASEDAIRRMRSRIELACELRRPLETLRELIERGPQSSTTLSAWMGQLDAALQRVTTGERRLVVKTLHLPQGARESFRYEPKQTLRDVEECLLKQHEPTIRDYIVKHTHGVQPEDRLRIDFYAGLLTEASRTDPSPLDASMLIEDITAPETDGVYWLPHYDEPKVPVEMLPFGRVLVSSRASRIVDYGVLLHASELPRAGWDDVFLSDSVGSPRIIDFGLGRFHQRTERQRTRGPNAQRNAIQELKGAVGIQLGDIAECAFEGFVASLSSDLAAEPEVQQRADEHVIVFDNVDTEIESRVQRVAATVNRLWLPGQD